MLSLPWGKRKRLGETDSLLMLALATYVGGMCRCGCGQHTSIAHDPDTEGRWLVEEINCRAGAEKGRYQKDNEDLEPGTLLVLKLTPREGDEDADDAADTLARRKARQQRQREQQAAEG